MAKFSTGTIRPQKARNSYSCFFCKQPIDKGTIYALRIGLAYNRRSSIYSKYHLGCWLEVEVSAFVEFEQLHQKIANHESGLRTTKLSKLTPEQKLRRQTLQSYISKRDIPALKKAYKQKSTSRVVKVMNTFASRWEEFNLLGVKYKNYLWKDPELDSLITRYDYQWMVHVFKENLTPEEQTVALRRTENDKYLPDWGTE